MSREERKRRRAEREDGFDSLMEDGADRAGFYQPPREEVLPPEDSDGYNGSYLPPEEHDGYDGACMVPRGSGRYEGAFEPEAPYGSETEEMPETYDEDLTDEPDEPPFPEKHSIFRPDNRRPNFILSVIVNVIRILALLVVLVGVAGAGIVFGIARGYVDTAPTLDLAALDGQAQTTFIYDCNGKLITEYNGTENRVMVSLAAMPKYLQQAFIAVEDARFYTHNGVDLKRIVGAFVANLGSGSNQGGSTITQQLIKNTLLSSEQSYKRKIQEAWLSLQLEQRYTKEEILECYLNTIYLGENYYGVQVAAAGYFGKELGELTLRECAMLAGTTNSPYYYNPRRNFYSRSREGTDYAAITNDRTDYVLRCMYENQYITRKQYEAALDPSTATVLENGPSAGNTMYAHAHYVEYAVKEAIQILLQLNGLENTAANRGAMESKLRTGGYHIMLAMDPEVQESVEETFENWTKYPNLRDPSDKIFRTSNGDGTYTELIQPQAAAVVLDYRTGELKAIVGSRLRPTAKKTMNRATDMKMPVGSSIKPIAVYAPALELGASPASVVYNMPVPIMGWTGSDGKDSWPKNYGGGGYVGAETLRAALKASHNTSAAWVLMTMVGTNRSVDFLHRLGVDDDHIDNTPFGLSLGSSGITPLQMTVAYGVLANGGVYQTPISILGISDSGGRVVWDGHQRQERRRVFSESTCYMVVDMMKDAVKGGTGTSAKIKGQTVAGKTGTNSDQKGVFFAGITGYYTSALWIGHDNYKALSSKSTGSGAAAPLWQAYMAKIHKGKADRDILEGSASDYNLVKVETCAVSGQLATDACRNDTMGFGTVTDYWARGTQPTTSCQMHVTASVCLESGEAAGPYCVHTEQKGVITIPTGHPLYRFLGTRYQSVLEEYLGPVTGSASSVCSLHTAAGSGSLDTMTQNTLIPDARELISQAKIQLTGLDYGSTEYRAIANAVNDLEDIISRPDASRSDVAGAMGVLSQAMAGFY